NIKMIVSYDGSGFHGWQTQKNLRTIQETIERALCKLLGEPTSICASGRTDAGVHAMGQVFNFRCGQFMPLDAVFRALNAGLPGDIRVMDAEEVDQGFHARRMSKSKLYVYIIDTSEAPSPFLRRYALHEGRALDLDAMQQAAAEIQGRHDFISFMASGSSIRTTTREVYVSRVFRQGTRLYYMIEGSGFLRYMVRNIVGTLLLVGRGRMGAHEVPGIIAGRDRSLAGPTVGPQGLYLLKVRY
ncbi:MAG: tRNA pseudouridine(38-40) synthase TruA, partial [Thermodesulfobacteriota bacterium]|nr:tRNA pseudouridine(38-40) synthase TruA [Thermodesulfobacteriota bacterium]